jgi:hypothetical protein
MAYPSKTRTFSPPGEPYLKILAAAAAVAGAGDVAVLASVEAMWRLSAVGIGAGGGSGVGDGRAAVADHGDDCADRYAATAAAALPRHIPGSLLCLLYFRSRTLLFIRANETNDVGAKMKILVLVGGGLFATVSFRFEPQ